MNTKKLMIGNYVYYRHNDGEICTISKIKESTVIIKYGDEEREDGSNTIDGIDISKNTLIELLKADTIVRENVTEFLIEVKNRYLVTLIMNEEGTWDLSIKDMVRNYKELLFSKELRFIHEVQNHINIVC